MGKYTFVWEHPAEEVIVTGTFDDWKKSVKLEKIDGVFKKTVQLSKEKVQYKFFVDDKWCTNDSAPGEDDGHNNYNNILTPEDISDDEPADMFTSSAAPDSSTAELAGAVPKVQTPSAPGAFPETPGTEFPLTSAPTEADKPAEDTKEAGKEEQTFSVNPLPAMPGVGNPVHLEPGEKVPDPSTLTGNTVQSTVTLDKESYEKSDRLPPQLGPVTFTPEKEREAKGGMFDIPPVTGPLIPESSLPKDMSAIEEKDPGVHFQSAAPSSTTAALGAAVPKEPKPTPAEEKDSDIHLSSAAPESTTAGLAAAVPKEPKPAEEVPETVKDSLKEAHASPEAAANPEAVEEKKEVEAELKKKLTEETSVAAAVPNTVKDSLKEADVSAEAAANPEAVEEKKEVEAELKKKLAEETSVAAAVPDTVKDSLKEAHVSAEAATNPEAVEEKKEVEAELKKKVAEGTSIAADIPQTVIDSQKDAHVPPEASANAEAVEEKKAVEEELKAKVPEEPPVTESSADTKTETPVTPERSELRKEAGSLTAGVAATAAATASAFAGATYAAKDKAAEALGLNGSTQTAPKPEEPEEPVTETSAAPVAVVPEIVTKSQEKANAAPEASANPEAVEEKAALESELLKEVKTTDEAGEPAPTVTAETSATAPSLSPEVLSEDEPLRSSTEPPTEKSKDSGVIPLLDETTDPAKDTSGLNAPSDKPAEPSTSKPNEFSVIPLVDKSTDENSKPSVTTGVETEKVEAVTTAPEPPKTEEPSSTATGSVKPDQAPEPAASKAEEPATKAAEPTKAEEPSAATPPKADQATEPATPAPATPKPAELAAATPESSKGTPENGTASDKKKKRRSFFGKLKDKLLH